MTTPTTPTDQFATPSPYAAWTAPQPVYYPPVRRSRRKLWISLALGVAAVLGAGIPLGLHYLDGPDSGVAVCKQFADTGFGGPGPAVGAQAFQITRDKLTGSRYPGLRVAGVTYLNLAVAGAPSFTDLYDPALAVWEHDVTADDAAWHAACAAHGVPLPADM